MPITRSSGAIPMEGDEAGGGGQADGKSGQGRKRGALRWFLYGAAVALIILTAAFLTLGVTISTVPAGVSLPYTTTYEVSLPASEKVTIGNTGITAVPSGSTVALSINGRPAVMGRGETRTLGEGRARISALSVGILDLDYRLDATYLGTSGDAALFSLTFRTSRQVPSFLIERFLPGGIQARPA